ncbi:ABC transporter ATP-binding protein [Neorhizobium sp. T25_13]|uniref:ABC transporter ATP-binding protein n=1 Tax=Neorhizobium sp. T25_13 TaxID=2093830 RepID=UPI000CF9709D|nr:sn-glycerol-3-phosphate ABC transporter ATP-binding protein UgpC [Neorhizobium sp. T25_13]
MARLKLSGVKKSFGGLEVIKGVDLDIKDGEFVVFVGPSGCGKSTLLRMIAGLEDISGGTLEIDGTVSNKVEARDRGIAMVFQSYALYPHLTVAENMGFSLSLRKTPKAETTERVLKAAQILKLDHLLDRKPSQLSGGQRQRVAIGRAIVREPSIFLFDEPLSNLDAALRMETRTEIAKLHRQLAATMIYVTHDQVEAMTLADKIVVLNGGVVQQVGAPMELYQNPCNAFVAGFIGSPKMNLLTVDVTSIERGGARIEFPGLEPFPVPAGRVQNPGKALLGIRPQAFSLTGGSRKLSGRVVLVERMGPETVVNLRLANDAQVLAVLSGDVELPLDSDVSISFSEIDAKLFPISDLH